MTAANLDLPRRFEKCSREVSSANLPLLRHIPPCFLPVETEDTLLSKQTSVSFRPLPTCPQAPVQASCHHRSLAASEGWLCLNTSRTLQQFIHTPTFGSLGLFLLLKSRGNSERIGDLWKVTQLKTHTRGAPKRKVLCHNTN